MTLFVSHFIRKGIAQLFQFFKITSGVFHDDKSLFRVKLIEIIEFCLTINSS